MYLYFSHHMHDLATRMEISTGFRLEKPDRQCRCSSKKKKRHLPRAWQTD